MTNPSIRTTIASASFTGIGIIFLYVAFYGDSKNILHVAFWYLGCSLDSFALAIQPHVLLAKVSREGLQLRGAAFHGAAAVMSVLGSACMFLALFGWMVATLG